MNATRLKRRTIWLIVVNAVCVLGILALVLSQSRLMSLHSSQTAARRWTGGEDRFAQVSAFFALGSGISEERVYALRESITSGLSQESITAANPDARLWYDAYSATGRVSVRSDRGTFDVIATGVGGDFFKIHPFTLRSGYYFSDADLTDDRVLLDENAAWQLFGSPDVVGMEVIIGGRPFVVAGVVAPPADRYSAASYGESLRIYMSYSAQNAYQEIEISCYEAVLPDPVSGFSMSIFEKQFSGTAQDRILLENSSRFSFVTLFSLLWNFSQSRAVLSPVTFPWWENAARMLETDVALCRLFTLILCIAPFVTLVIAAVFLWRRRPFHFRDIPDYYEKITFSLAEWRQNRKLTRKSGRNPTKLPRLFSINTKKTKRTKNTINTTKNGDNPPLSESFPLSQPMNEPEEEIEHEKTTL